MAFWKTLPLPGHAEAFHRGGGVELGDPSVTVRTYHTVYRHTSCNIWRSPQMSGSRYPASWRYPPAMLCIHAEPSSKTSPARCCGIPGKRRGRAGSIARRGQGQGQGQGRGRHRRRGRSMAIRARSTLAREHSPPQKINGLRAFSGACSQGSQ